MLVLRLVDKISLKEEINMLHCQILVYFPQDIEVLGLCLAG